MENTLQSKQKIITKYDKPTDISRGILVFLPQAINRENSCHREGDNVATVNDVK